MLTEKPLSTSTPSETCTPTLTPTLHKWDVGWRWIDEGNMSREEKGEEEK